MLIAFFRRLRLIAHCRFAPSLPSVCSRKVADWPSYCSACLFPMKGWPPSRWPMGTRHQRHAMQHVYPRPFPPLPRSYGAEFGGRTIHCFGRCPARPHSLAKASKPRLWVTSGDNYLAMRFKDSIRKRAAAIKEAVSRVRYATSLSAERIQRARDREVRF